MEGVRIEQTMVPPINDECHYDIKGLPPKKARKIFTHACGSLKGIEICDNGIQRQVEESDIATHFAP